MLLLTYFTSSKSTSSTSSPSGAAPPSAASGPAPPGLFVRPANGALIHKGRGVSAYCTNRCVSAAATNQRHSKLVHVLTIVTPFQAKVKPSTRRCRPEIYRNILSETSRGTNLPFVSILRPGGVVNSRGAAKIKITPGLEDLGA